MTETTDRPSVLFVCVHNAGRASVSVRPIRDEIRARVLTLATSSVSNPSSLPSERSWQSGRSWQPGSSPSTSST